MRRCLLFLPTLLALSATGCDGSIGSEGVKSDSGQDEDLDGDGYSGAEDCDDTNPDVHIEATEICDGLDNDCDAKVDANDDSLSGGLTLYPDNDADTYGDNGGSILSCEALAGYVETAGDCNDADGGINPDANESCLTSDDDDCDGDINDDGADGCADFYADADGDGFAEAGATAGACLCFGNDEYPTQDDGDCDDSDPGISPGAEEICSDGIDQNCDGSWSECRISSPGPVDVLAVAVQGLTDDSYAGAILSAGPDVDEDGAADLAISIPNEDRAYVYTSAPATATTLLTADITFEAPTSGTLEMIQLAADVSGDGVADVLGAGTSAFIGDPQIIVWKSPTGTVDSLDAELLLTDTSQSTQVDHLYALHSTGTVADIFVHDLNSQQIRYYLGTASGEHQHSDYLYGTLSAPGAAGSTALDDIDGDGLQELAVQMPDSGSGSVDVLLSNDIAVASSTSAASWTVAGEDSGDKLGAAVASAGDIDGDGYGDIIVGAPNHDDTASNAGAAYVFLGQATPSGAVTGADAIAEVAGELRNNYAGTSVAGLGDIDSDGSLDIGVGAPGYDYGDMDNPGAAYVVYGPFTGYQSLNDVPGRVGGSNTNGDLGAAMAGPADLNNDGYNDLIVGEPGFDTAADDSAGTVWIYWGQGL